MSLIIATPKATNANSYLTVARADALMALRLYATAWTAATGPTAEDYLANGAATAGASLVAVDTGSGSFTVGSKFRFSGHATEYTVTAALSAPGNLAFSPVLASDVADNEAISRTTANDKEKALVWATSLLDAMMEWEGVITEPGTWNGTEQVGIQALRWPRYPVANRDGNGYLNKDTIPADIERATVELALVLLTSDRFAMPSLLGQGIQSASVGSLSVTVSKDQVEDLIPPNIYALVAHLGRPIPQAHTGGTRRFPVTRR